VHGVAKGFLMRKLFEPVTIALPFVLLYAMIQNPNVLIETAQSITNPVVQHFTAKCRTW
jgi:uncharacterized membrane protein